MTKPRTMNMFTETNEDLPIISGMARTEVVEQPPTDQTGADEKPSTNHPDYWLEYPSRDGTGMPTVHLR